MKKTQLRIFTYALLALIISPFISLGSIVVLNGLTHENNTFSGDTYRTQIVVQNLSEEIKSVRVYQKDYWYSHTGETKHDPPGTMERSNANWISYQPELLNLLPNEKKEINVEVHVPSDVDLSGSYWSVLMVEGIVPPDTSNTVGVSIRTAIRYAVQIISNVKAKKKPDLTFRGLQLAKQEGTSMLDVMVENTGNILLKPEMSLELFNSEGESVAIIKSEKRKTLPGTSIRMKLILEGVKPGTYTGVLVADCGDESIFGTNVSFEITE